MNTGSTFKDYIPVIEKNYPQNVQWHSPLPIMPLPDLLTQTATDFGDCPGFNFFGKRTNWRTIYKQSLNLAAALQKQGAEKGIHIGIFLPNCPLYLIAYYAILMTGATVVNYNPLYARREIESQISDSQTRIMITADLNPLYGKIQDMPQSTCLQTIITARFTDMLPFPKNVLFRLLKHSDIATKSNADGHIWLHDITNHNDNAPDPVSIDPQNDIAVIQYTGGTTGIPKGAMLTHANLCANVEQAALWFSNARPGKDKTLGVIPFFHVFAMTAVLNLSVRCGFEIIATPRFDLADTLRLIARTRPQIFPAVPAIYSAINNHPDTYKYDLTSLRYCISGGAPLPVEVKKQFEQKTGCTLVEGYGLTESSPVACVNPIEGENRPGSIGLPLPGTIVEIRDKDDKKTVLPIGARGELCIKGPQVMKGYWNRQAETDAVLKDGYLFTADIAKMDKDGYICIVDRLKDMIITNGYNVYPRNIEEAIYQHPDVEECIVAGLPDKRRGELVKAWIKPKPGKTLTTHDLKQFLKERISPMEMPKSIEFRDEALPKTLIGKLSRKDILAEEKQKMSKDIT